VVNTGEKAMQEQSGEVLRSDRKGAAEDVSKHTLWEKPSLADKAEISVTIA